MNLNFTNMIIPGAFERYLWYITAEGSAITRKQVIESVTHLTDMKDFENSVFMRLFKAGLFQYPPKTCVNGYRQKSEFCLLLLLVVAGLCTARMKAALSPGPQRQTPTSLTQGLPKYIPYKY